MVVGVGSMGEACKVDQEKGSEQRDSWEGGHQENWRKKAGFQGVDG